MFLPRTEKKMTEKKLWGFGEHLTTYSECSPKISASCSMCRTVAMIKNIIFRIRKEKIAILAKFMFSF